MANKPGETITGLLVIVVIGAGALWWFNSANGNAPAGMATPGQATAATTTPAPALPKDEGQFIEIAERFVTAYKGAANDMAKGGQRAARAKELCAAIRSAAVRGWVGTIYDLSSNSDGKGVLAIQISRHVWLKTWNNSLSDISDHTLIEPASAVFGQASQMKKGEWAAFGGSFLPSRTDCMEEPSLTQEGSMTEPEFIFRFAEIKPAG